MVAGRFRGLMELWLLERVLGSVGDGVLGRRGFGRGAGC